MRRKLALDIAGHMKQDELERIERDVRELRVPVVVICIDTNVYIPEGTLGRCTQVLCWNRYCGPADGLLMRGSRLTYMYEDCNDTSSSWSVEALETAEAAYAQPLPSQPATAETTATAALQDDPEYNNISILLERLWLRCAPDSYTVAAFREQIVR